jgi:hypothetical protein
VTREVVDVDSLANDDLMPRPRGVEAGRHRLIPPIQDGEALCLRGDLHHVMRIIAYNEVPALAGSGRIRRTHHPVPTVVGFILGFDILV